VTAENYPTLGVRFEVPNKHLAPLKAKGNNPKIKKFHADGEYVKTHCFCYAGEVMAYICGPYFLIGGRADASRPTPFTNVNLLYKSNTVETTQMMMETLRNTANRFPNNVLGQDIKSFLGLSKDANTVAPYCRGEISANLAEFYPAKILEALRDFADHLISCGYIDITGGLAHEPSAEWINSNIKVTPSGESSLNNLYFVGDASGKTQGIVAAAVMGVRAANEIALRERL